MRLYSGAFRLQNLILGQAARRPADSDAHFPASCLVGPVSAGRHNDCFSMGEGFLSFSIGLVFGYFANPWAWTYFVFIVTLCTWRERIDEKE